MVAVLTGDVVNSRNRDNPNDWLSPLKDCLTLYGKSPAEWEIFRGDSFQLLLSPESKIMRIAFHLKAALKSVDDLDVRLAIGVGDLSHQADRITESNGSAFVRSGELFDQLKNTGATMALLTNSEDKNAWIERTLTLAAIIADNWNPGTARVIAAQLTHVDYSQTQLADELGMSQAAVSKALKRGHFSPLMTYADFLTEQIKG